MTCRTLSVNNIITSDKLRSYSEFVKEAVDYYDKLPQETGELYKRYFINIPFNLKEVSAERLDSFDDAKFRDKINNEFAKLGIKFDVCIGSGEAGSGNSRFTKVEGANAHNELFQDGMHNGNEDKYVAFVNALSTNYVFVDVPDGTNANINMLLLNSDKLLNTKIFIKVGNRSKLDLFEYYGSTATKAPSSLGVIHEIDIGIGSDVGINALHNENTSTIALAFSKNRLGDDSVLKLNSVYNGAMHTRVRNVVEATGRNSRIDVTELVLGSSDQKFDICTRIINKGANSSASLESKAALMDKSFCILKGFAKIEKGATKAKSYVHERGILLNSGARVNGLPDMSVDETDVKATHSSATAPIDPESVFYLMSKGIDEIGVKKLLVTGFFANSISKIQNNIMREMSMSLINFKLEAKTYGAMPSLETANMWVVPDAKETDMFKGHYKYREN